jgi:hypothetical protein
MQRSVGLTVRALAAGGVGFAIVSASAAYLRHIERTSAATRSPVGAAPYFVLIYVFGLPVVGWVALRVLTVRPAWAVALTGPWILAVVLMAFYQPAAGFHRTTAAYGLQGALAYALAYAIVIGLSLVMRGRPDRARESGAIKD